MVYPLLPSPAFRSWMLCAAAVGLLGLSVGGCVRFLEPRTGDATYYLLSADQNGRPIAADTTGLKIGLRKPRMASYLEAIRMVTRRGPHEIRFSEFHRWGESLSQGISRTVGLALADQRHIQSTEAVPWPEGATFDYVVQVHVLRFEGVGPSSDPEADENTSSPKGHTQMVAEWKILRPDDDSVLARGATRHRTDDWRVGDHAALASNLSDALDALADDLGTQLRALNRP